AASWSFDRDRRYDGNAERQRRRRIESVIDDDLDRHALHDLDEIPGGVLRRESSELGARAELDAVDMAGELEPRIGVDRDPHLLARPHTVELGLLEIRRHPDFRHHDGEDRGARLQVIAELD